MRVVDQHATLNNYGDVLISTTGVHGGDVSSQRVDELDHACLAFLETIRGCEKIPLAIDIGGGFGSQSKRMAEAGANVYMIDLTNQFDNVEAFNSRIERTGIVFFQSDIRTFDTSFLQGLDIIYSQRMLSCLPYLDARRLLDRLHLACAPGARCFVSAGGLHTEIGRSARDREAPIEQRWLRASSEMAAKHEIYEPECLYTEDELAGLLDTCRFRILRRWTSEFGNPKVICERR